MEIILAIAFFISAVLPLWGLINLYSASTVASAEQQAANSGSTQGGSYEAVEHQVVTNVEATIAKPKYALRDIWLIGSGLVIGMAASIVSLWC